MITLYWAPPLIILSVSSCHLAYRKLYPSLLQYMDRISLQDFNSLAPGRFQFNFRKVIFKVTVVNGGWGISYEIALRWLPLDLTDDTSTLVQVMAWCHQATSHYLSQCWPRSMSPYGVTRPQWVKHQCHWTSLTYNLFLHCPIILTFCTEQSNDISMRCVNLKMIWQVK